MKVALWSGAGVPIVGVQVVGLDVLCSSSRRQKTCCLKGCPYLGQRVESAYLAAVLGRTVAWA